MLHSMNEDVKLSFREKLIKAAKSKKVNSDKDKATAVVHPNLKNVSRPRSLAKSIAKKTIDVICKQFFNFDIIFL